MLSAGRGDTFTINCSGFDQYGVDPAAFQAVFDRKAFRPVVNYSVPTHVNISFTMSAIVEVDAQLQLMTSFLWLNVIWYNPFIRWNPEECGGMRKISIAAENLWLPDIFNEEFEGLIKYDKPVKVVSICNLDIFYFPFDEQNCTLTFSSFIYTVENVILGMEKKAQEILNTSKSLIRSKGEWVLLGIHQRMMKMTVGTNQYDQIIFYRPSLTGSLLTTGRGDRFTINCSGFDRNGVDPAAFQAVFDRKAFRPVVNYSIPTHVNISFTLSAILEVMWDNPFIRWNTEECVSLKILTVSAENLWLPDIFILELCELGWGVVGEGQHEAHLQRAALVDSMLLGMDKEVWEITDTSRNLIQTQGEWELLGINKATPKMLVGSNLYDQIMFYVAIRRRPSLYVINLLVPSGFLVAIDALSFYLPAESKNRAPFKMILLLGYNIFLLMMNDLLPASGNPLISVYFALCLSLMVVSLLETIFITYLLHLATTQPPPMPQWLHSLLLCCTSPMKCCPTAPQKRNKGLGLPPAHLPGVKEPVELVGNVSGPRQAESNGCPGSTRAQQEEETQRQLLVDLWDTQKSYSHLTGSLLSTRRSNTFTVNYSGFDQHGVDPAAFQTIFNQKDFRPVINYSIPTQVNISFTLSAILEVIWNNPFISWDPEECGAISKLTVTTESLWLPDIFVMESMDVDQTLEGLSAYVTNDGHVVYNKPMRVTSICSLDIFYFPFDQQNCTLTFSSFLYTVKNMLLGLEKEVWEIVDTSRDIVRTQGEWELLGINKATPKLSVGSSLFDQIMFYVAIRRRPSLYVINLLVPSSFLIAIDALSFYLPAESGNRVPFKITLLLGYNVFLLMMNKLLPANGTPSSVCPPPHCWKVEGGNKARQRKGGIAGSSGLLSCMLLTPIPGVYFALCLSLMAVSLLETIFITYLLHLATTQPPPMPRWLHPLLLYWASPRKCCSTALWKENVSTGLMPTHLPGPKEPGQLVGKELGPREAELNGASGLTSTQLADLWMQFSHMMDTFLFHLYLLFLASSIITVIVLWNTQELNSNGARASQCSGFSSFN
ncbi:hypothetical protein GH733_002846 [Mirounga leonina]|nr:hypothetical protein GH733_002846 [Mirounga leonina]